MTEEFSLFEIEAPQASAPDPLPIREEQVAEVRAAFASAEVTSMEERRAIIESCVQRDVKSIHELKASDVRYILERLRTQAKGARKPSGGSLWDDRDEATWIDNL